MDLELERQNKKAIKRTMLMQERTFKYQVKELHRLHGVQKKLMEEPNIDNNSESGDLQGHEEDDLGSSDFPLLGDATDNFELENPTLQELTVPITTIENRLGSGSSDVRLDKLTTNNDGDEEKDEMDLTLSLVCVGGIGSSKDKSKFT